MFGLVLVRIGSFVNGSVGVIIRGLNPQVAAHCGPIAQNRGERQLLGASTNREFSDDHCKLVIALKACCLRGNVPARYLLVWPNQFAPLAPELDLSSLLESI